MLFLVVAIILILAVIFCNYAESSTFYGGGKKYNKMDCHNMRFIKQGTDSCWRDSSMYIFVIPKESFALVKDRMYKVPEIQKYATILRRDEHAAINQCTPGGGDEQAFMEALLKTMGLTYTTNPARAKEDSPDFIFDAQKISKKTGIIPKVPNTIKGHKLIGMMFHVEYESQPWMGHVASTVLCRGEYWRFYNNCGRKVFNFHKDYDHMKAANESRKILHGCMGKGSRVDEVNFVYCLTGGKKDHSDHP